MIKTEYHRNLPHFQRIGKQFFVTIRLKGSLPVGIVNSLKRDRDGAYARITRLPPEERLHEQNCARKRYFASIEAVLDTCSAGPTWLRETVIAEIVQRKLHAVDQKYGELLAYCIMPNHVHAVLDAGCQLRQLRPDEPVTEKNYRQLYRILQELKGSTGFYANQVLKRSGAFWQPESFDHYVRNEAELGRIIRYVLENPVKAGLIHDWKDWTFSYVRADLKPDDPAPVLNAN